MSNALILLNDKNKDNSLAERNYIQKIICKLYRKLPPKFGAGTRIMTILMYTPNGTEIIPCKIMEMAGIDNRAVYYKARKELEELGFITINEEQNTITINYDKILNQ